jgi:hypothetical protein
MDSGRFVPDMTAIILAPASFGAASYQGAARSTTMVESSQLSALSYQLSAKKVAVRRDSCQVAALRWVGRLTADS